MNKQTLLELNVVPEGKAAWLTFDQHLELKRLFEAVPLPAKLGDEQTTDKLPYLRLHRFLTEVAGLTLPLNEAATHFNAFTLIRRGYKIETITYDEYEKLCHLLDGLKEPHPTDMDLVEVGGHRQLYIYLTKQMGLSVSEGRGPTWHRAKALIDKYRADTQFL